jgi:hypothetical protein
LIKRLISIGDSCIFGSELSDVKDDTLPSKLTYPAIISQQFDLEYLCLAKPGASNQYIVKTLLEYPFKKTEILLIQWTNPARFGLHLEQGWHDLSPNLDDMNEAKLLATELYKKIEVGEFTKLQFEMCVSTVLQKIKIPMVMTSNNVPPCYENLTQKFENKNFLDFCKPFAHGIKGHPLEEAHVESAKCIKPYIADIISM